MKTLASLLAVLALSATFATAADEKPAGERKKADPEAAFKKFDGNGDGSLTLDEYKNSPRGKKDAAKAEEFFSKKDTNSDKSLSLDEFKAQAPKGEKKKKNN